jgi:hypothetical protein
MGAALDAISTADAQIGIDMDGCAASIIAIFYRACRYAGMAVDAFFLINGNQFNQFFDRLYSHGELLSSFTLT